MPTDLQIATLHDRFSLRKDGLLLERSWAEVSNRVCNAVAEGDDIYALNMFKDIVFGEKFIPAGRILAAMGAPEGLTPYNCTVLRSPEDSRKGMIVLLEEWIEFQARGSGVGVKMSTLRPSGSPIRGVNGTSSGPIAWMELLSTATHKVIQQGGSRRGAAMLILNDSHPDIFEFIKAKETPGVLEGANLSVSVSDSLMRAVKEDKEWDLRWNDTLFRTIPARELWAAIIGAAWRSGEPGVVFLERANRESNSWYFEDLVATNPCAEQPLGANSVCLLGSINLPKHMAQGKLEVGKLHGTVMAAVRFLDNVIDRAFYPSEECQLRQAAIRRMGIGTIGLADALISAGLRYGSPEAITFTEEVYRQIKMAAYQASIDLSKERGPFPAFDERYLKGKFIQRLPELLRKDIEQYGIRNAFLTSQAPTGTIAKLMNVWSGIEPYFAKETRFVNRMGTYTFKAPDSEFLVCADEVSPEGHLLMQAAAQKHTDSAVSKTVNAPNEATLEDTKEVYDKAYDLNLKSVAYYRDGSRAVQVQYKVGEGKEECHTDECSL